MTMPLTPSRQSLIDWAMINSPAAAVELFNRHDDAAYVERWMKVIELRREKHEEERELVDLLVADRWLPGADALRRGAANDRSEEEATAPAAGDSAQPDASPAPRTTRERPKGRGRGKATVRAAAGPEESSMF